MKMPTLKKTVVDPRAVDQIITGEETPAPTTRAKKGKTRLVSISLPDEILDKTQQRIRTLRNFPFTSHSSAAC